MHSYRCVRTSPLSTSVMGYIGCSVAMEVITRLILNRYLVVNGVCYSLFGALIRLVKARQSELYLFCNLKAVESCVLNISSGGNLGDAC